VGWTTLDDDTKKKLELNLMNHEKANPVEKIKRLDGAEVPENYKPQTIMDEPPDQDGSDSSDD
jgi:hypothetical protein